MSCDYYINDILVEPVFLSGTKSSGKSLIYSLLRTFENFEGVCKDFFLNHILQLNDCKSLSNNVTNYQIKSFLNFKFYESAIGRNLNSRIDDETSLWESPYIHKDFLKIFGQRGPNVANELSKRSLSFLVDSHNLFMYTEALDRIYDIYYLINVTRSPVSVLNSWVRDTFYGKERLSSKLSQHLCLKINGEAVPLIVPREKHSEFLCASDADRCAIVFFHLHEKEKLFESDLAKSEKFLNISFEKTINSPEETYNSILRYLCGTEYKNIENIFTRERVPRNWSFEDEVHKLSNLKPLLTSQNYINLQEIFNLWAEKNEFI